jgi:hypothetical protein
MKLKLPRYRWWWWLMLLPAAVIGLAASVMMEQDELAAWQLSGVRGQFTVEQYDRIRLGMTPAEVSQLMGSPPSDRQHLQMFAEGGCSYVASEDDGMWLDDGGLWPHEKKVDHWVDAFVWISVRYRDGKASIKTMYIQPHPQPPPKSKAREWLDWLRGLVG